MNIAVFTYDFAHVKSEEFLLNLIAKNIRISCVIGAPWVDLHMPKSVKRIKVKRNASLTAREICERFNIPYHCCAHNSEECEKLLKKHEIDLGIIAGARILKSNIIDSVKIGILNLHPGLIPEVRGLDTLQWAVYDNIDIGITAHFINKEIDKGSIIDRQVINVEQDDTFFDLSQKMSELELKMMLSAVEKILKSGSNIQTQHVDNDGFYYKSMENDKELQLDEKLKFYIDRHCGKK